jgi:hypothetical protein
MAVVWAVGCSGAEFDSAAPKGGTGGASGDGSGGTDTGTGGTGGDTSQTGGSSGTKAGKGGSSGSGVRGGSSGRAGRGGSATGGTSGGSAGDAGTAGMPATGGSGGTANGGTANGGTANGGTSGTAGSFPCVTDGECGNDGDTCSEGGCCACSHTCESGVWGPRQCPPCAAPICPVDPPADGSTCNACSVPSTPCEYDQCPVDGPLTTATCVDDHWMVTVDSSCSGGACCSGNGDCQDHHCIDGVCKDDDARGCWGDDQCGNDEVCSGIWVGPCNADCAGFDEPGTCVPKSGGCCIDDGDCKESHTCLRGVCKAATPDGCWSDRECLGGTCEGESICGCGMDCIIADMPGQCLYPL